MFTISKEENFGFFCYVNANIFGVFLTLGNCWSVDCKKKVTKLGTFFFLCLTIVSGQLANNIHLAAEKGLFFFARTFIGVSGDKKVKRNRRGS